MGMVVMFDVVGTLFSFRRVRLAIAPYHPYPDLVRRLCFSRLWQTAFATTLAGGYASIDELSASTLGQVLSLSGIPMGALRQVLAAFGDLEPRDDAAACLARLTATGSTLLALTNDSVESTRSMLAKAQLDRYFDDVVSADEARAHKPHPSAYRLALRRGGVGPEAAVVVSTHAWDVTGAAAVGMNTVWVSGVERLWPLPGGPPGRSVERLGGVPEAVI